MSLSIIIPVFRDAKGLKDLLDEFNKDHINTKSNFKIKVKNISKLIKKLKD